MSLTRKRQHKLPLPSLILWLAIMLPACGGDLDSVAPAAGTPSGAFTREPSMLVVDGHAGYVTVLMPRWHPATTRWKNEEWTMTSRGLTVFRAAVCPEILDPAHGSFEPND